MLVWTSALDLAWNDLALKPVFLPFVHQLVRTLAGLPAIGRRRSTVGQVAALDRRAPTAARPRVAVEPSGRRVPLDPARGDALEVTAPGFYEVRPEGQGQAAEAVVAANVDLAESDLAGVDPADVAAVATGGRRAQAAAGTGLEPPRDEVTEQSQRLWWYLLLAGMLLLMAESLVASRHVEGARRSDGSGARHGAARGGRCSASERTVHWRRRGRDPRGARALAPQAPGARRRCRCWWPAPSSSSPPGSRSRRCASRPTAILAFRIGTIAAILGLAAWAFGRRCSAR